MGYTLGKIAIAAAIAALTPAAAADEPKENDKPNIIYVFTDQQSANMMSCVGNRWLKTPTMDYVAANGIRFTRAYATKPVCVRSRISPMTGRFSGYFTVNNKLVETV
ncbi:sulfatase-like hydrolase/transferase [Candidatus Pelagisphaera phototrophica]|uniref:sulfatase-like hydrolase/transferase n=1 Tax=Candidatus Pelagisphaera phototrophica TaxID=2684113 RepID=UPI001A0C97F3|nr:sulfatase-like hydrolase/transferase [Candidatus Pelagisphaera phototrophica]QXD33167.1 sulfatase-like hydrolase/transferase [Candidatus Pelagisphaera phototrophica]